MQTTSDVPRSLLLPNERVLWTGAPSPLRYALLSFSLTDCVIAGILIGVGAFTIMKVQQYTVLPIVADMFAWLVIVAGAFQLLFSPVFGYVAASGIVYAVTNERLLIIDKRSGRLTQQTVASELKHGKTQVSASGCVYFSSKTQLHGRQVGFEFIKNPVEVARLIDETFRDST